MIAILSFTPSYHRQALADAFPDAKNLDFTAFTGVRGYCDEVSRRQLSLALSDVPTEGIHFLDSGNYHYLSLLFLEKISSPFSLVVFDHHTDMQPSAFDGLLSCGSWIWEAVHAISFLKEVLIIGVGGQSLSAAKETTLIKGAFSDIQETGQLLFCRFHSGQGKIPVTIIKEQAATDYPKLFSACLHYPVYLSIDKDVLSEKELKTDWDQGSMPYSELENACRLLIRNHPLIGTDICGEPCNEPFLSQSRKINCDLAKMFSLYYDIKNAK